MDTLTFQCLECESADAIAYAESKDGELLYCICLSCGELMLVGDCEPDTPLYPSSNDIIFYEEETNALRAALASQREQTAAAEERVARLEEACNDLAQWVRRRCPADNWPVEYTRAVRALAAADAQDGGPAERGIKEYGDG